MNYEDWTLALARDEAVQIDMDAVTRAAVTPARAPAQSDTPPVEEDGFDTLLELRRSGSEEPVARNDDRAGSLNSTIEFTAADAGEYVIRARPLFYGAGEYTLRVSRPSPVHTAVLAIGRNEVAAPDAAGPELQERLFSFQGTAEERVRLELRRNGSGDQLELRAPDGTLVATAGELSPNLTVAMLLPSTGTYRVVARLHRTPEATGPYSLDFQQAAAVPLGNPSRIRIGEVIEGEIGLRSPAGASHYGALELQELYELRVRTGQVVTVSLESAAFDPVIDAGAMSAIGFASAVTDDDGGGGLNSRLVLHPRRSGSIVLRVRALGSDLGPFRLRVSEGETPVPAD